MSLASDLVDAVSSPRQASVQVAYGSVISASSGTMSVLVRGGVAEGVRMTRSCASATVGQRVVLIGSPPLWTAVGVLA